MRWQHPGICLCRSIGEELKTLRAGDACLSSWRDVHAARCGGHIRLSPNLEEHGPLAYGLEARLFSTQVPSPAAEGVRSEQSGPTGLSHGFHGAASASCRRWWRLSSGKCVKRRGAGLPKSPARWILRGIGRRGGVARQCVIAGHVVAYADAGTEALRRIESCDLCMRGESIFNETAYMTAETTGCLRKAAVSPAGSLRDIMNYTVYIKDISAHGAG